MRREDHSKNTVELLPVNGCMVPRILLRNSRCKSCALVKSQVLRRWSWRGHARVTGCAPRRAAAGLTFARAPATWAHRGRMADAPRVPQGRRLVRLRLRTMHHHPFGAHLLSPGVVCPGRTASYPTCATTCPRAAAQGPPHPGPTSSAKPVPPGRRRRTRCRSALLGVAQRSGLAARCGGATGNPDISGSRTGLVRPTPRPGRLDEPPA
jgi:hypothetical protein